MPTAIRDRTAVHDHAGRCAAVCDRRQTEGGFFVMEVDVAPEGGSPPLHMHNAAEFFWTLRAADPPQWRVDEPQLIDEWGMTEGLQRRNDSSVG